MKTLLHINSSIYSVDGNSSRLAEEAVATWRIANPGGKLIVRDLARDPVPHLTAERFSAFLAQPHERTPEQRAAVEYSDALIAELKRADAIVMGLPLYNFGVPSALKAYFDHVARAGVTFRYTAAGAEGLLRGKKAWVIAARGGVYAGTPAETETPYVRQFLGFLGIEDVDFIYAEGLAIDVETKEKALADARARIAELIAPPVYSVAA